MDAEAGDDRAPAHDSGGQQQQQTQQPEAPSQQPEQQEANGGDSPPNNQLLPPSSSSITPTPTDPPEESPSEQRAQQSQPPQSDDAGEQEAEKETPMFKIASFASSAVQEGEESSQDQQSESQDLPMMLSISSVASVATGDDDNLMSADNRDDEDEEEVDDPAAMASMLEATPDIVMDDSRDKDDGDSDVVEVEEETEESPEKTVSAVLGGIIGGAVEEAERGQRETDGGGGNGGMGLSIASIASISSFAQNDDDDVIELASEEEEEDEEEELESMVGAVVNMIADYAVGKSLKDRGIMVDFADDDVFVKMSKKSHKRPMLRLANFADLSKDSSSSPLGVNGGDGVSSIHGELPLCSQCGKPNLADFASVVWETMQFCGADCLAGHQRKFQQCSTCDKTVVPTSMGKYCVRFGSNIRQFCSNQCLEDHKRALKVCYFCQRDILGGEGFLAPVGGDGRGQFKDFCAQSCLKRYQVVYQGEQEAKEVARCAVCGQEKTAEVELVTKPGAPSSTKSQGSFPPFVRLCGPPCASAYKFANGVRAAKCDQCTREFDDDASAPGGKRHVMYYGGNTKRFCGEACKNVFVMRNRSIVPCAWCKVKKYNFDMVEKWTDERTSYIYCSLNCLNTHGARGPSLNGLPPSISVTTSTQAGPAAARPGVGMPVIQSVSSLAGGDMPPPHPDRLPLQPVPPPTQVPVQTRVEIQKVRELVKETVVYQPEPKSMKNKGTLSKPFMQTKGVSCRPHPCHKETQTDESLDRPVLLPVPVPFYVPVPVHMYSAPYPVPVPVPMPVPVPVFVPTTRNSAKGIMKQISKIRSKMPADPFEAEMLAMAGVLAGSKADSDSDDSADELNLDDMVNKVIDNEEQGLFQHPLSMQPPPSDFEKEVSGGNVVPKALPPPQVQLPEQHQQTQQQETQQNQRGQKRRHGSRSGNDDTDWTPWEQSNQQGVETPSSRPRRSGRQSSSRATRSASRSSAAKRSKTMQEETNAAVDSITGGASQNAQANSVQQPEQPAERPDANHHLKFTYGVNAWKHWVVQKNVEIEQLREQGKYLKNFETDILKLRCDELSYTLCMFVREVKKPNGDSYAPDSILYLTLGIQEYLFENGRMENIFTDFYYEPFTTALHEVVKDFSLPVNELGYFVTRIEEEHLWEARQLGAHSPQVLLNTLVYFNSKYFMLKSHEQHKNLAFTHIDKHWTREDGSNSWNSRSGQYSRGEGPKTSLLRYNPPARGANRRDATRGYEQLENPENPLRCPVKLYEFYLSKCPENVRNQSDMFYLQPERSCVPDSPVWYSATAINDHTLEKMVHRLLMVREVQEHMLADAT